MPEACSQCGAGSRRGVQCICMSLEAQRVSPGYMSHPPDPWAMSLKVVLQVGLVGSDFCFPILQSYIDICILGCLEYGEEAAKEFIQSTQGWQQAVWLNDRVVRSYGSITNNNPCISHNQAVVGDNKNELRYCADSASTVGESTALQRD